MRRLPAPLHPALVAAVVGLAALAAGTPASPAAGAPLPGAGAGCPLFPGDNVSRLPVHPRSGAWLASMGGPDRRLHPDVGPNGDGQPYGIPYTVVPGSTSSPEPSTTISGPAEAAARPPSGRRSGLPGALLLLPLAALGAGGLDGRRAQATAGLRAAAGTLDRHAGTGSRHLATTYVARCRLSRAAQPGRRRLTESVIGAGRNRVFHSGPPFRSTRFNRQAPVMQPEDDPGEIIEDVDRIHPAVERLRRLLESAAILDMKASSRGYWASREWSDGRPGPGEDRPGR